MAKRAEHYQPPLKRRGPLAAERGGNEYEEQEKRCFKGMTPPVDAKVSYKLNGSLYFGVVAKLYNEGPCLDAGAANSTTTTHSPCWTTSIL